MLRTIETRTFAGSVTKAATGRSGAIVCRSGIHFRPWCLRLSGQRNTLEVAMREQPNAGAARLAAFALMALIWGLTWLPMKLASEAVPPIFLAAVRFVLAGLCFLPIVLAKGLPLRPAQPGRVIAASLLISTGCYGL